MVKDKVCRGPGPAPAFFLRPAPDGAMAPEKLLGPGPGGAMAPTYFFGPGIFSWPRPRAPDVVFGPGPGGAIAPAIMKSWLPTKNKKLPS